MRKMMSKEVTKTTVKIARMEVVDGKPVATTLADEILLGNVGLEKAQKAVTKKHGAGVSVFQVVPSTEVYELEVDEFIKIAKIKVEVPATEETEAVA